MKFVRFYKAPEISPERMKELLLFQNKLNLKYKNIGLLNNALIHSSFANEAKNSLIKDNERLEFLGDSVLSISVSTWLYNNLNVDEGECTRIRSIVVSEDSLFKVAEQLELDKYILIGKGEEQTGGRHKKAILADCTEAVFASIYLDKGFLEASDFILKYLVPLIEEVLANKNKKDYKTLLQEYVQKRYKKVPEYKLIKTVGPEHEQTFFYTVEFHDQTFGPLEGHNKKDAEQNVAKLACTKLGLL